MGKNKSEDHAKKLRSEFAQIQGYRKYLTMKPELRSKGCNLPFYDLMDSYEREFQFVIEQARKQFPSILEIIELDDSCMKEVGDIDWLQHRYPDYEMVEHDLEDGCEDYVTSAAEGTTVALKRGGQYYQFVAIRRVPTCQYVSPELHYAIKLPTLHHELGHVHDMVNNVSGLFDKPFFPVVAAESYANVYALDRLAERCCNAAYYRTYDMFRETCDSNIPFMREIGRCVMEQHPKRQLIDWQTFVSR